MIQSQTQGSFCDVGNSQDHVGADERALPVALDLMTHFFSFFQLPDLISLTGNCNDVLNTPLIPLYIQ